LIAAELLLKLKDPANGGIITQLHKLKTISQDVNPIARDCE
jgi:hypothetical protein